MSDDLISREQVLHAISIDNLHPGIVSALQSIIEELPSVYAVTHGRWKEVSDDMYAGGGAWICSSCHYGFSWKAYGLLPEEKYCPHCGARMDGEERKES